MPRGVPKAVVDMLRAVPLLSECSTKELRDIANIGAQISVRDRDVLTKQGEPGREFFLLVDGKAHCQVDGVDVAEYGPGDFFGEMALLERGPRRATVAADGPAEALVLDSREFGRLLDASPSIARKLLTSLARRELANANLRS